MADLIVVSVLADRRKSETGRKLKFSIGILRSLNSL